MSDVLLGAGLGVASSIAINWGYFTQHGASAETESISIGKPLGSLKILFANSRWLGGFAIGVAGWGAYVAGLRFAPLSVVQASFSGGIGVLAILSHRFGRTPLSRREIIGVGTAVGGLVLLAATLGADNGSAQSVSVRAIVVAFVLLALLGAAFASVGRAAIGVGAALGIATGCFYAAGDVASKAAVDGNGLFFIPLLIAGSIAGFYALQIAFQRDSALVTAGLSTLSGSVLPIAVGFITFHDRIPAGALGALRIIGFVGVVLGATGLMGKRETAKANT